MPFGVGSRRSPPSKLFRVCIGPPTLPEDQTQGRFNLSWDPLPCHLQNGADISGYTIQYTQLSTGVARMISNHHTSLLCDQESGGPYSCRVVSSLFRSYRMYAFQVAAQNNEGIGSFSDPITKLIPIMMSQGSESVIITHFATHCFCRIHQFKFIPWWIVLAIQVVSTIAKFMVNCYTV